MLLPGGTQERARIEGDAGEFRNGHFKFKMSGVIRAAMLSALEDTETSREI